MDTINTKELRKITEARKIIDNFQERIWRLENTLDDLSRACEIAQYSQQYSITEVYREEAENLLKDRLVMPELPESTSDNLNIRILTGSMDKELQDAITEKAKKAAGV